MSWTKKDKRRLKQLCRIFKAHEANIRQSSQFNEIRDKDVLALESFGKMLGASSEGPSTMSVLPSEAKRSKRQVANKLPPLYEEDDVEYNGEASRKNKKRRCEASKIY